MTNNPCASGSLIVSGTNGVELRQCALEFFFLQLKAFNFQYDFWVEPELPSVSKTWGKLEEQKHNLFYTLQKLFCFATQERIALGRADELLDDKAAQAVSHQKQRSVLQLRRFEKRSKISHVSRKKCGDGPSSFNICAE
jgi:hypothetical protein